MIIITAGKFGNAIGARVNELIKVHIIDIQLIEEDFATQFKRDFADEQHIVFASWRPYPEICEAIDNYCYSENKTWTMVELHGQRLTCGPTVVPGKGACYSCYKKRYLSHHRAPERELVLTNAYQKNPALGPEGYCMPMVELAATAIVESITKLTDHAGKVRIVDVLGGTVIEGEVIGIHACKKCGEKRTTPSHERFTEKLIPELAEVLE